MITGAIRDYAQAVEAMGYTHILVFDHVLGASPDRPGGWRGPYTYRHAFHEPFVLFGFLAAVTRRVELVTGIVILPQRQTALVAKQAAEVDVLSDGRLRLGVGGRAGTRWSSRRSGRASRIAAKRIEEQIEVMRALWTTELVTIQGRWHRVTDAGINPLAVQRPIPVWMGGGSEPVLDRMARLADGWMPHFRPGPRRRRSIDRLHGMIREAGRDPAGFGIEGRMTLAQAPAGQWDKTVAAWRAMQGVTHLAVHTVGLGLEKPDSHIEALRRFKEAAIR